MPPLYYTGNTATPKPATYILRLDNQDWLRGALFDALNSLAIPHNWQQVGDITPENAASFGAYIVNYCDLAVDMLGMIMPFVGTYADVPDGAFPCDGRSLNVLDYPRLAALFGAFYPDDFTFNLPDMRAQFVVGMNDNGHGVANPARPFYSWQGVVGSQTKTLTVGQLPAHSHVDAGHTHVDAGHTHAEGTALPSIQEQTIGIPAPAAIPGAGVTAPGFANIQSAAANIQNTGNGDPIDITPRSNVLLWIIIAQWGAD